MKISAIIPAYNASKFLERAVQSLIDTGYSPLEIVIIDDGSKDGTMDVAKHLQKLYPETIVVFQHPNGENRGVSASRNLGIRKSSGELICFLDADDYVYPCRFDTAVSILKKDNAVDGVYELTKIVFEGDEKTNIWWDDSQYFGLTESIPPDQLLKKILRDSTWHTSGILCRRNLLIKTGLFNKKMTIAEDCHLWFRMAAIGKIVSGELSRPVSAYCRHPNSLYQPILDHKVAMVKAMSDAYRWSCRQRTPEQVRSVFLKGTKNYILNSIIIARESSRLDVVWKIFYVSIIWGGPFLLTNLKIIRQIGALARDNMLQHRLKGNVYKGYDNTQNL